MRIEGPFVPSGFNQANNTHSVQPGETLASVAKQYGISTRELADANQITVRKHLTAGMELSIPEKSGPNHPASTKTGIAGATDRFENHKPGAADSLMQPAGVPMEIVGKKSKTAIETLGHIKSAPGDASIEQMREGNAKTAIEFSRANGDPITSAIEGLGKSKGKTAIESFGHIKSVPGDASIEQMRAGNAKTAIEILGHIKSVPGDASIEQVRESNAKTAIESQGGINGAPVNSPIESINTDQASTLTKKSGQKG